MRNNILNVGKYVVSLGIAIGLLWFVFGGIDLQAAFQKLKTANISWILLSMFVSNVANYFRAWRWTLLMEPIGYKVKKSNSFYAVMIGYLANMAVPRLGEVTRCSSINKTDHVPINISFGTVILERVVDVCTLLILTTIGFCMEFTFISTLFENLFHAKIISLSEILSKNWAIFLLIGILIFAIIYGIYSKRKTLLQIPFILKIQKFVSGLGEGVLSIKKLKNRWLFASLTICIWFLYAFYTYLLFFAVAETSHLSLITGFIIMLVGGYASAAPVQGGIGVYHIMVQSAFFLYGIDKSTGLIVATIMHLSQMINFAIIGAISAIAISFIKSKDSKIDNEIEHTV